jgi:hypothetical protein
MKKDMVTFRTDVTFWLAILILLMTMLSRHVGKLLPVNLDIPTGGIEVQVNGQDPDS